MTAPTRRLLGVLFTAILALGCGSDAQTTTMTIPVELKPFRIVVRADGTFTAAKSTPLNADPNAGRTAILSLTPEGRMVDQDEVVIVLDGSKMTSELNMQEFALEEGAVKVASMRLTASKEKDNLDHTLAMLERELDFTERFARRDPEQFSRMDRETDEADLTLLRYKLAHNRTKKARHDKKLQASVAAQEARLSFSRTRTERLKKQLASLEIHAPHSGTFFHERKWRGTIGVGDTVFPGMKLANIPDLSSMVVDAYVLESEASGIEEGTAVEISAAASPDLLLTGTVLSINPFAEQRSRNDPTKYFRVRVGFEKPDVAWIKPMGEVKVRFLVADIAAALAVPNQALFSEAGETWVYRRVGGRFEKQIVQLGQRGPNRTIILEGLTAGDHIATAQPTEGELE
ncbi:efflux RND transporter periplasmic adaptor subunit [Acanthopleuribacter pedis]|uniref:Efflux RND transporter periplasmic adaptor subunit n=1 Tax=Acanthopleuribacter pedis TaxID=442870 RepID=A0A8J7Q9D4_9BACT|nr:efflux RND transporter periplasmic adaptor subunit [Acanthopleuribacter pedis]MBO1321046.1 efflux RND transporter periplasmic adaptor subunit [Acanthopleuribacter pedis]